MPDIIEEAVEVLNRGGPEAREWLRFISEAIRKAWSPDMLTVFESLDDRGVTAEEGGRLREALVAYYSRIGDEPTRRECLRILARHGGPELKDDLIRQLHLIFEVHRSIANDLYQIIVALENIGEKVYPSHQSSNSVREVQANVDAADRYLREHGFNIPF